MTNFPPDKSYARAKAQGKNNVSQQNVELADLGIEAGEVRENWTGERLYEQAVRSGEGEVAKGGALLVKTGKHTGRSA